MDFILLLKFTSYLCLCLEKLWQKIYLVVWRTREFFFLSYFVLRLTFENIIVIKPQYSKILNKLLNAQIDIMTEPVS